MARLFGFWNKLSKSEKRYVTVAIIVAVLYVTINYVIDPFMERSDEIKQELKTQQTLLKRYEHLLATSEKVQEKWNKIQAMEAGIDQILLSSPTSDLANAEMQGLVKNLAQSAEIKFTRISPGKSVDKDGFTEITLKLPFSGNIKQIAEFLYALESDPVFFNIKHLSIQKRRSRRKAEPLKVNLTVAAYIRTPEETETSETESGKEKTKK